MQTECFAGGSTAARTATYAFIDVETTGFTPGRDAVVEVACVIVSGARTVRTFSSFIDPRRPIPATATALHHIGEADVAGAPALEEPFGRSSSVSAWEPSWWRTTHASISPFCRF